MSADPLENVPKAKRKQDRRCVASGQALASEEGAIRFVLSPESILTPDLAGKLPGRGAWVGANDGLVLQALQKDAFSRAFKQQAKLPTGESAEQFVAKLADALAGHALNGLGLAKRAGGVISGFEKVKAALQKGKAVAYVHARDASDDGVAKLTRLNAALPVSAQVVNYFDGAALDKALGETNIVHLAVTDRHTGKGFFAIC